jgi:sporulation integral membrane protein YlbJ
MLIAGAVAVGMFGMAQVSGVIMASHYLAAVGVGLVMRFYKQHSDSTVQAKISGPLFSRAARALVDARSNDARPFGQLMGDSIRRSVNSLLLVGGFIILFSCIISILEIAGVTPSIAGALSLLLGRFGLDTSTVPSLVGGMFEITIGTQMASQATSPLVYRLMAASAIIGWSGLSVHAQVAAMMQGTDVSVAPYVAARLLHAVFAATACLLLSGPLSQVLATPVIASVSPEGINWTAKAFLSLAHFLKALGVLSTTALGYGIARTLIRRG